MSRGLQVGWPSKGWFLPVLFVCAVWGLSACAQGESTPPRPTVIVITANGPYSTSFDDPGDWLVGESDSSQGRVEDGRYLLTVRESRYLAWTNQQRAFGDGVYEVDVTLVSGAEASAFGLLLLGSSDLSSFFYCVITGDGRYDIGYCEDNCQTQQSLIGGFTLAYAILTGNQTNHLRIELQDGQLKMLVNGTLVGQMRGLTYSSGLVGLVGESGPYGGFEAAFDNLQVVEEQFSE